MNDAMATIETGGQSQRPVGFFRSMVVLLFAACLAAVVAWQFISHHEAYFDISEELRGLETSTASAAQLEAQAAEMRVAKLKDAMLHLGVSGALFAGLVGLAAGINRGRFSFAMRALVVGVLLGAITGTAAGFVSSYFFTDVSLKISTDEGLRAIFSHIIAWVLIGGAVGTAGYMGHGADFPSHVSAGCFSGLIAGALACPLAQYFFPLESPEYPVPSGTSSVALFVGLPAVLLGLAIARVISAPSK